MTTVTLTGAAIVSLTGVTVSLWVASADQRGVLGSALSAAVVLAFVIVGAVVVGARPQNRIGWLMLAGGTLWSVGNAGADLAFRGIVVAPGSVELVSAVAVAGQAARALGWYLVTVGLAVFFPTGRVAGPRWRWLSRALLVVLVAAALGPVLDKQADLTALGAWQNPIAPGGDWKVLDGLAFLASVPLSLIVTVGAIAQLVSRWRSGSRFERDQLWLFAGAAALPIVAAPIVLAASGNGWIFDAAALPLPFAVGFAVLARGLYDVRTATNRMLVWVTLSAAVVGIYALLIAGLSGLLSAGGAWVPWLAAAVVAVSFGPLRDGLQRGVNQLTFGRWDEPYEVLSALGQRVEATADVDGLLCDVVIELRGLGLEEVSIHDIHGRVIAGNPPQGDFDEVKLSAFGEVVGEFRYRAPDGSLRPRDRRLLEDLAGHLGGVLHANQLTSELQRALERLVVAREEERRRLRRDLHDGLGPALAGHLLRLDVLAGKVDVGSAAATDVASLREEVRATVLEVRRLVEGLRPPALDELGLAGALTQVAQRLSAGSSLTVDVTATDLPVLPAATEVAAFRIVSEAVTNVVRHADASRCRVTIGVDGTVLRIAVRDDGCGIGDRILTEGGNGLQTMRERAEEVRGRIRVASGSGTTVLAELPLPGVNGSQRPTPAVVTT